MSGATSGVGVYGGDRGVPSVFNVGVLSACGGIACVRPCEGAWECGGRTGRGTWTETEVVHGSVTPLPPASDPPPPAAPLAPQLDTLGSPSLAALSRPSSPTRSTSAPTSAAPPPPAPPRDPDPSPALEPEGGPRASPRVRSRVCVHTSARV